MKCELEAEAPEGAAADPFEASPGERPRRPRQGQEGREEARQEEEEEREMRGRRRGAADSDGDEPHSARPRTAATAERWYALSADDVAKGLGVDPATG